ncbi:MAG: heme o synthase [Rhodospirillaceae bacterium]|jgi:protoheme IX farnesyltransferase|nr:heme o synthase [Rhodospirillaceae bacterium]
MTLRRYIELLKLRIGVLLAITAMAGYFAVAETVQWGPLLAVVVAMLLCSSGSSVFNHFYDRDIDRKMERTRNRPLASGAMADPNVALWLAGGLLVAGCALALYALNWIVALHLALGAFTYMVIYTVWLKRRHWMNIVIGGAAGSFPVLAGAAAADPSAFALPMLMAITLFLWTPSHFWALAMMIKDDYEKAGVPMLPVLVGDAKCAKYMMVNTVLLVISAGLPVAFGELGPVYLVISSLLGVRFLWLNWRLVLDPSKVLARKTFFFSMSYLAFVFVAIVLDRNLPIQF